MEMIFMVPPCAIHSSVDRRRELKYDKSKIGTRDKPTVHDFIFLEELKKAPCIPYNVGDTSHLHLTEEHIRSAACTAYQFETNKFNKYAQNYAPSSTLVVMETFRTLTVDNMYKALRTFYKSGLYAVFGFWLGTTNRKLVKPCSYTASRCRYTLMHAFVPQDSLRIYMDSRKNLADLNEQIKSLYKLEWLASVDREADDLEKATAFGNINNMYSSLAVLAKKSKKRAGGDKTKRIMDDNGHPATSVHEENCS